MKSLATVLVNDKSLFEHLSQTKYRILYGKLRFKPKNRKKTVLFRFTIDSSCAGAAAAAGSCHGNLAAAAADSAAEEPKPFLSRIVQYPLDASNRSHKTTTPIIKRPSQIVDVLSRCRVLGPKNHTSYLRGLTGFGRTERLQLCVTNLSPAKPICSIRRADVITQRRDKNVNTSRRPSPKLQNPAEY